MEKVKIKKIKLGSLVRDVITELEGIVIARIDYLNGCVQYSVQPKVDKQMKLGKVEWVDEEQLEVIGDGVIKSYKLAIEKNAVKPRSPGGGVRSHPE